MPDELKPCPFCASTDTKIYKDTTRDNIDLWFIVCFGCEVQTAEYMSEEAAINAWNRRDYKDETK